MLITSLDHANMTFAFFLRLASELAADFLYIFYLFIYFVSIKVYLGFAHNFTLFFCI